MCKISIVVPVYNTAKYLKENLDSITEQTLSDIEIICIDDGSTDDSLKILYDYAKKDSRIKVLRQTNQFAGVVRNNGMKKAKGEYIIFLDSDDVFEKDMLEKMYSAALVNQLDVTVCRSNQFDNQSGSIKETPWTIRKELLPDKKVFSAKDIQRDFFNVFVWWPWDKLYKKSFLDDVGIEFQSLRTTNDLFFCVSTVLVAERIGYIDNILVHHRIHEDNSLENTRTKSWDCFYKALRKVRDFMCARNIFERFEQDYVNYCLAFSLWHYNTLHSPVRYLLRQKLCREWFDDFGINSLPKDRFYNVQQYQQKELLEATWKKNEKYKTMDSPKVSIVIPCLNSLMYLPECLESVIEQTLAEIEIICVDAGSTDGSLELLQGYAAVDSRIKIIHSNKKSYGFQMNLGFNLARGEYIGIVESDDYAEHTMFEILYNAARLENLDLAKSGFFNHYTDLDGSGKDIPVHIPANAPQTVFCPIFSKFIESPQFFNMSPSIWTGLYKTSFIRKKNILFTETPGASYQDTAFTFKVWCCADRVRFIDKCLLHYRRDNEASSSNSRGKVYCVVDEYNEEERFLQTQRPQIKKRAEGIRCRLKYGAYLWNYKRLAMPEKIEFLKHMAKEFSQDIDNGFLRKKYFNQVQLEELDCLIQDYRAYHAVNGKHNTIDARDKIDIMKKLILFYKKQDQLADSHFKCIVPNEIHSPIVSVIIPVFNTDGYIKQCVESIMSQSLLNIEIICIDDGSTDNSLEILCHCAELDHRISVYTQENCGQGTARNRGASVAQGQYIYFMDSDDVLSVHALSELVSRMDDDSLDVVYFDADSFQDDDEIQLKQYDNYYKRQHNYNGIFTGIELMSLMQSYGEYRVSPCLQVLRRAFYEKETLHFPEGIIHEDNVFTFISMLKAQRVGYIHKSYYKRRIRNNSTMTKGVTWDNAYGYYTCFWEMMNFIKKRNDFIYTPYIYEIVRNVYFNGRNIYRTLPWKERKISLALPDTEQVFLRLGYEEYVINRYKNQVELSKKTENLRFDLDAIQNSVSFRIGRCFTWGPRKIRGGIRCLIDHGLKYTLSRTIEHLGIDMGTGDFRR